MLIVLYLDLMATLNLLISSDGHMICWYDGQRSHDAFLFWPGARRYRRRYAGYVGVSNDATDFTLSSLRFVVVTE